MRGIWDVLYRYAQKRAMGACFQNPHYTENRTYSQVHLTWLREHLDPEALTHFNDAWKMAHTAAIIQQEQLFRTALETGLSLGFAGCGK